jgi:hypothetical protein
MLTAACAPFSAAHFCSDSSSWWPGTVAIEPTLDSVVVLAIIVLVRTVLSLSIGVEIDGRWPWQPAQQAGMTEPPPAGTFDTPRRTQEHREG